MKLTVAAFICCLLCFLALTLTKFTVQPIPAEPPAQAMPADALETSTTPPQPTTTRQVIDYPDLSNTRYTAEYDATLAFLDTPDPEPPLPVWTPRDDIPLAPELQIYVYEASLAFEVPAALIFAMIACKVSGSSTGHFISSFFILFAGRTVPILLM